MQPLTYIFFIFGVVFTQLAVLPAFGLGRGMPQLALALIIWLLFHASDTSVIGTVFLTGLLLDLYSSLPFGAYTFGLLVSLYCAKFLLNSLFPKEGSVFLLSVCLVFSQIVFQAGLFLFSRLWFYFHGSEWRSGWERFFSWHFLLQLALTWLFIMIIDILGKKFLPYRDYRP